jgi:hypothetical protein
MVVATRQLHGYLLLTVFAILAVGCGAADAGPGDGRRDAVTDAAQDGDEGLASLASRLPATTASFQAVDAVVAADALGADRGALGGGDLPAVFDEDGDLAPSGALNSALGGVIGPLAGPFATAHKVVDLGQVRTAVTATTPDGAFLAILTDQPTDALVDGYTGAGFESGDGGSRYLLPDGERDRSGGFPVVLLTDGLVVLASTTEVLDRWDDGEGPGAEIDALLSAAGDAWAVAGVLDGAGAAGCAQAVAIVSDGVTDELLLLDGGSDSVDREAQASFEIGDPSVDGEVTRYPLESSDPIPAALVTGGVLVDGPPLSRC